MRADDDRHVIEIGVVDLGDTTAVDLDVSLAGFGRVVLMVVHRFADNIIPLSAYLSTGATVFFEIFQARRPATATAPTPPI
jgi:hypothetical protein